MFCYLIVEDQFLNLFIVFHVVSVSLYNESHSMVCNISLIHSLPFFLLFDCTYIFVIAFIPLNIFCKLTDDTNVKLRLSTIVILHHIDVGFIL